MSIREKGQIFNESRDTSDEGQTISDRSQITYQDTIGIIQDLKNKLSKTESISNKSKDVFQNIQNTLSEIRGEDITSIPEPISSRLRKVKFFAKGESLEDKTVKKLSKSKYNKDIVL